MKQAWGRGTWAWTVCAVGAVVCGVGRAGADMVSHASSVPLTATNWTDDLSFPMFDPSRGTLEQVDLTLSVSVEGTSQFENLDLAPAVVLTHVLTETTVLGPGGSPAMSVPTMYFGVDFVADFDGAIDFAGGSGRTVSIAQDATDTVSFLDAGELGLFIGAGTIALPIASSAFSGAGGAGGLVALMSTATLANATLNYQYSVIPAPPAVWLGMIGMGFIDWVRRRSG